MNTPLVISLGTGCALSWLITYILIIAKTIADQTAAIPFFALVANITWEFIYGFTLEPGGDYMHLLTVIWFLFDLVIAYLVFKFSRQSIELYLGKSINYYTFIMFALVASYLLLYFSFIDLSDPAGEYTGFGVNLLMTYLFIDKFLRCKTLDGQSIYIAIFKFIGTLLAFVATLVEAITTVEPIHYVNLIQMLFDVLRFNTYPLTNLVKVLYLLVFVGDLYYIFALYKFGKGKNVNLWQKI